MGRVQRPAGWGGLPRGEQAITEPTIALSPAAAAFVDVHVAAIAHTVGPAQLGRLVTQAIARSDPDRAEADRAEADRAEADRAEADRAEADRAAAAEHRRFDLHLRETAITGDVFGTVRVEGELDLADALDLETAVAAGAVPTMPWT